MGLFAPKEPDFNPPPAALPPTLADPKASAAAAAARNSAALAAGSGFANTVATGGQGATATATTLAQPTLLGAP